MKRLLKKLALYTVIAAILFSVTIPVLAANPKEKCKITVNEENVNWKLEPFLAYAPQGNALILLPMKELFTTLGYTVTYDSKLNRSTFTADKNSDYVSFYVDLKTGQVLKEDEKVIKGDMNCAYLINDSLYVVANDYFSLDKIAKSFLNDSTIKIDYDYVYTTHEDFIVQYKSYFPIQSNLSSLKIEITEKYTDHPFVGEQYTKYNTGKWISGTEVKSNFNKISLSDLWDGFDNLHFYTGKGERNELTGKGTWNSTAYAISWELMDAIAEEVNKLRKQNGLSELTIDHSLCFVSVGAKDLKIDSVFDNVIHNIENNTAAHTYNDKTKMAECMASGIASYSEKDKTTLTIASHTANQWYKSAKGHKEIIMGKKYKTMGILVVITDTRAMETYAVFK